MPWSAARTSWSFARLVTPSSPHPAARWPPRPRPSRCASCGSPRRVVHPSLILPPPSWTGTKVLPHAGAGPFREDGAEEQTDPDRPRRGAMVAFHVDSEVGPLRRVLLHRPGLEFAPPDPDATGTSCSSTTSSWVERARQEHDAFADVLADRGVEVLLRRRPAGRDDAGRSGSALAPRPGRARARPRSGPGRRHARHSTRRSPRRSPTTSSAAPRSTSWPRVGPGPGRPCARPQGLRPAAAAQPPLHPRHDGWIYGGVSLNPMALPGPAARDAPTSRPSTASTRSSPAESFAYLVRRGRRGHRRRDPGGRRRPGHRPRRRAHRHGRSARPRRPSRRWPAGSSPAATASTR